MVQEQGQPGKEQEEQKQQKQQKQQIQQQEQHRGLVHLYCGEGKGKTTAAMGLAVRACGAGWPVVIAQFFKDGSSSEIGVLRSLPGVQVVVCETHYGFFRYMDEATKADAMADYGQVFCRATELALASCQCQSRCLLVLDEAVSACNHGVIQEQQLLDFLSHRPAGLEVVLTGRRPSEALQQAADYITEMRKQKHPYDRGIGARKGIEY